MSETQAARLFEYGIQTERSDIRAHVSIANRTIYVFQTKHAIAAIERLQPRIADAYQEGIAERTAEGWVVPIEAVEDLRRIKFYSWERWSEFAPALSTTAKGKLAVACVIEAMRRGRFPIWFDAIEDHDANIQILGTDLLVFCRKRVQVKCDYRAGDRPNGSGNLFLQRAERNPLKRI